MPTTDSTLLGLASPIFQDSSAKFLREQKFGKRLYLFAWTVEILAASLGLIIAVFVAYDAYSLNSSDSGNSLLNAVMGALPFMVIAIIELTKIPLASGLYRVRNFGWKIFILISLLALTVVTFETMFTGLERQMTNITAKITDGKVEIQQLIDRNQNLNQQINQIESRDVTAATQDISIQIDQAYDDVRSSLPDLEETHGRARAAIEDRIVALNASELEQMQALTALLDAQVASGNERILQLQNQADQLQEQIDSRSATNTQDPRIQTLENDKQRIVDEINETENWLNSNEAAQISRAQVRIGVTQDGRFGENTRRNFESWRQQQLARIASSDARIEEIRLRLDQDLNSRASQLDQVRSDIQNLRNEVLAAEANRSELSRAMLTAPPTPELARTRQDLELAKSQLNDLIERQNSERAQVIEQGQIQVDRLIEQRRILEEEINSGRLLVPELKQEINANQALIVELENTMRQDARNNQVYRFAQKWGYFDENTNERLSYEDILDVKEKDLSLVGAIWFGSIAVICATMGTVLALVANIMTDPDAFIEKQRSRKVRPIQRGLRRLFVAVRKKLLKRREVIEVEKIVEIERIVEIDKEVEKFVEVEKIVEIEKIVEKEIDKYIPEIIPVPIFIPSDADHEAEMLKAQKYYSSINEKVERTVKAFENK